MRASTQPSSNREKRSIELDFLRGIAILLVLGSHYTFPFSGIPVFDHIGITVNSIGGVGVDLFFTLSGFLVGGLLLKEYKSTGSLNPKRFLIRRAFKIWPPLYFLVIFHAILGRHSLDSFFWQNIFHVQNYFGTSIQQTWSLAVEEHFYIFLVLLFLSLLGRSAKFIICVLLALCVISIIARIYIVSTGDLDAAFRQSQYRMESLLYGVILAVIYIFYPNRFAQLSKQKWWLLAATFGLAGWIYWTANNDIIIRSIGYTIHGIGFSLLLILVYIHSGRIRDQILYRITAWIGVYSYGIYLWHTVALEPGRILIQLMESNGIPSIFVWLISVGAQFGAGITVGFLMTKMIEWPFLRFREKLVPVNLPKIDQASDIRI